MNLLKKIQNKHEANIVKNYLLERDLAVLSLWDYAGLRACIQCNDLEIQVIESDVKNLFSRILFETDRDRDCANMILFQLGLLKKNNEEALRNYGKEAEI